MALLLTFGTVLLVAVLLSERAERTVLSTAVLFLGAGLAFGSIAGPPEERVVRVVSELALVTVLLTDGSRVSLGELRRGWALPGRALLLGMPLTMVFTAAAALLLLDLSLPEALLVGAVLAPTDPVFASAIVGRDAIPAPVRKLLGVESGLNDGLALPFVILFLAWAAHGTYSAPTLAAEIGGGVAIGIAVPLLTIALARTKAFGASEPYLQLGSLGAGIVVYALCSMLGANAFLGSFAAGVTIGTVSPRARRAFAPLGESLGELLKLGALLLFGALLTGGFLVGVGVRGWIFAALALLLARPLALGIALLRTEVAWRERLVAGWFGPKGFASVVYGLLVVHGGLERAPLLMRLIGATILLSIVAHSSTDVPVERWYRKRAAAAPSDGEVQPGP